MITKPMIGAIKAFLYILSVSWAAYLIYITYKKDLDFLTALISVLTMLGSMIVNDLLDMKS